MDESTVSVKDEEMSYGEISLNFKLNSVHKQNKFYFQRTNFSPSTASHSQWHRRNSRNASTDSSRKRPRIARRTSSTASRTCRHVSGRARLASQSLLATFSRLKSCVICQRCVRRRTFCIATRQVERISALRWASNEVQLC